LRSENELSAVYFLWHCPSSIGRSRRRPGITWQRAQWSPDFPRAAVQKTTDRDHPVDDCEKIIVLEHSRMTPRMTLIVRARRNGREGPLDRSQSHDAFMTHGA
jgi:hypothetical protein